MGAWGEWSRVGSVPLHGVLQVSEVPDHVTAVSRGAPRSRLRALDYESLISYAMKHRPAV